MKRYYYIIAFIFSLGVVGLSPAHAASPVNSATCYLSGTSCTISLTNTSGDLLWVGINEYNMSDTLGVSDTAGNVYTVASPYETTGNGNSPQLIQTFYSANIQGGSNTITCTRGSSGGTGRCTVIEYSGIAASSPFDGQQESSEANVMAYTSGNLSTVNSSDLLVGYFATRNSGGSWTPESGWTTVTTNSTDFDTFVETASTASAGSYAATAGYSPVGWGAGAVDAFKLANSGGSGGATPSPTSTPNPTPTSTNPTTGTPTVPTGITISGVSTASVSFSWNGSTEQGGTGSVSGYKIYRNSSQVSTTGVTTYTDSGLTAGTTYTYTVAAYDTNGNTSSPSASAQGTTAGNTGSNGGHTYYIDYSNGSDSNNGTSESTSWQHAPGMNGCTAVCASTTPQPGDSIIFKGGVTWPNSAFSWNIPSSGTPGNVIYYGVNKLWYTGSSWTRPIFNLGDQPPTDSLYRIIILSKSYVTLDDFEITNVDAVGSPGNGETDIFDWYDGSESNVTVQNMYIHGWHNPYFSVGIGNLTAGSSVVTDFVPYNYSPAPTWSLPCTTGGCNNGIQLQALKNGEIPEGNSTPTVTAISGSGSYTITFTNTAGGATANCTGCVIQLGNDDLNISGGVESATNNDVMQDNVIDGSDTSEAQINPYPDCGLAEGDNNWCGASGIVEWRLPNIWRNNVIQYVDNVDVGECSEWSGNLIQYIRPSTNPTAHTNALECLGDNPLNGVELFYNNVIRHTNVQNLNTPNGLWSIGLGDIYSTPVANETAYIFNNVLYDTLQNAVFERGSSVGKWVIFNNSVDCGPLWALNYQCGGTLVSGDIAENNYTVTNSTVPWYNSGTFTTNVLQTPAQASAVGLSENQTYAYAPTSASSPTVGKGTNLSSFCAAISAANPAAGAACMSDTTYGVGYNTANHTVVIPDHTPNTRPSSGVWDVGAYEYAGAGGSPPADTQPPAVSISVPVSGATASGTITISGVASDNVSISSVSVSIDGGAYQFVQGTTSWTYSLNTASLGNGSHAITAEATDPSGNIGTSPTVTITVSNVATPPSTPTALSISTTTTSTATLAWTASTQGTYAISGYKIYRCAGTCTPSVQIGTSTLAGGTDTGLAANTTYTYAVKAYDTQGNVSGMSSVVQATTKSVTTTDTTPPTIAIATPASNGVVQGTMSITGTASDNVAVSSVAISIDGGAYVAAAGTTSWTFSWNTTLLANGSHTITAKATDSSGNTTTQSLTVTVSNPDTTAPSAPTALQISGTTTSTISLSWTASTDNVGVTGYKIFRNGTEVGTSTATSFTNTGLVASTIYNYTVSTYDAAGNNSIQSSAVSGTTKNASAPVAPPSDMTPPTIAITTPTNNEIVAGTVMIQGTASDNVSVASVKISIDAGSYASVAATSSWTYAIDTTVLANGNHTVTIQATDPSGNTNSVAIIVNVQNSAVSSGGGGGSSGGGSSSGSAAPSGGGGFVGNGGNGTPTTGTSTIPVSVVTLPTTSAGLAAFLQSLLTELNALIAQLNKGLVTSFTRNLTVGSNGTDVSNLQTFLDDNGYPVATSGPGSSGDVVPYFGSKTAAALLKWQKANGLPATGYFGSITREKIQAEW